MKQVKRVEFVNKSFPESPFDLVRIEELLKRDAENDHTKLHRVNFYVIMIITAGQGYHTVDFEDYTYQEGVIFIIRKDQVHKFIRNNDTKGFLVVFTEDFILNFLIDNYTQKSFQLFNEIMGSPKLEFDQSGFNDIVQLINHVEKEYVYIRDAHSLSILRSLLHILLAKIYRFKSGTDGTALRKKYVQEFVDFQGLVEEKCFQTKKVMDYAQDMGISTKKLNMIVQSIVQKPAKLFIDEILILKIKRLLINSDLSIKEIAYIAGFEEPSNMFKFFKRYTRITPESFRQRYL